MDYILGLGAAFLLPILQGESLLIGFSNLTYATIGVLIGSGLFLWIALFAEILLRKDAIGFGDIKFMGCIGAFCGWKGAIFSIFGGAFLGSIFMIALMLLKGATNKPTTLWPLAGPGCIFILYLPKPPNRCLF